MSPIVFVHGAGLNGDSWRDQTKFFEDAIAVDLPGHGQSTDAPHEDIAGYARWLGKLIRRSGPDPITLIGHSMGSLVALETAARNPDMVARLVLIAVAAEMPVNRELLALAKTQDPAAAAMIVKWSLPRHSGYGRPKAWVLEMTETFITSAETGLLASDFAACDAYTESVAMAEKVRCPTLLVLGENDTMTKPAAAQPLAAAIADARIVVVQKVGHMLPLEKADEVNEAINLFLSID